MTGNDVRALRARLGIGVPQLAELVGASPASVYRWEAAGAAVASIEPFQARLLGLLAQQVPAAPTAQSDSFANALVSGLLVGGGLLGLYHLLDAVFSDNVKVRRPVGDAGRRIGQRSKSPAKKKRPQRR